MARLRCVPIINHPYFSILIELMVVESWAYFREWTHLLQISLYSYACHSLCKTSDEMNKFIHKWEYLKIMRKLAPFYWFFPSFRPIDQYSDTQIFCHTTGRWLGQAYKWMLPSEFFFFLTAPSAMFHWCPHDPCYSFISPLLLSRPLLTWQSCQQSLHHTSSHVCNHA